MLAYKVIEKNLYSRRFAWTKLNFFTGTIFINIELLRTSKFEKFAIIIDS